MRLARPVSTLPGPISIRRFTPAETIQRTEASQRTGAAIWADSSSRMSASDVSGLAEALPMIGQRGARIGTRAMASAKRAAAARNIQTIDVVVVDTKSAPQELEMKVPEAVRRMQVSDPQEQNSIFLVTGSTSVFTAIATINKVAGNVPVVSMFPELVQPGDDSAALSIGVSFETSAHLSAQFAADILQGRAKASDLPVGVVTPPDIAVNFLKAKEIGLKVPFGFFESSSLVYDTSGKLVRAAGQAVP